MTMKEIITAIEEKIEEQVKVYNEYVMTQPTTKDERMTKVICGVHAMRDFLKNVEMNGYVNAIDND